MAPEDFPRKLNLVMKALSLSRGRLAAELGVSKSLVSRWASGSNMPAGHNLSMLTELIARRREGFTLLHWDGDLVDLAEFLGIDVQRRSRPGVVQADDLGLLTASRRQSALEVAKDGHAYIGLYVAFRPLFRDPKSLFGELIAIWRDGDRLRFRIMNSVYVQQGEVFVLRHQLYMVGEDDRRVDGLISYVLNGGAAETAIRLDGIFMSVAGDRFRTPTAARIVLQRLADLDDLHSPPDSGVTAPAIGRLQKAFDAKEIDELAGEAIVATLTGRPAIDGGEKESHHVFRHPDDRRVTAWEVDWSPELEADVRRVRSRILGLDNLFDVYGVNRENWSG